MQELLEAFQQEWAIRALLASSMVGIMCGALGCFIVLRNMALVGDALAHAILPGVVLAFVVVGYSALGFFTGAVLAGLATAIGITWIQQNVKTKNDAAIGIVFTAMFSIGVIGISWISHNEGVHLDLKDFLFGNTLGVYDEDLILTATICGYVLLSVAVFYRYLFVSTFQPIIAETMGISVNAVHYFLMLLLSFAVVASLQTVGVIQVVAMLITPASTALLLSNRLRWVIFIAAGLGLLSAVAGLLLAIVFSTTPGPMMAVVATLLYLVAVFFAPQKGLVFRFFQKRQLRRRIQLEDTLKQALRLSERGELTLHKLGQRLSLRPAVLRSHLQSLGQKKLLQRRGEQLVLSETGKEEASRLVRAHRLWETYLVEKMGLTEEQIHEEAEKYEHLLSDELLDEVDRTLGFPPLDPHGSPIPMKGGRPDHPLNLLQKNQQARIAQKQVNDRISTRLWELSLLPGTPFVMQKLANDSVELLLADRLIELPTELARQVNVETAN
ncbi:MAG: iron chelate uptake ABC transporter family permease subunit [Bacteroidota bacterium]